MRSLSQLYHTAWTTRDGAPPNVLALAQTPDGYLWLGGSTGLFRFDGVRFVLYRPATANAKAVVDVNRLLATRDGQLWVGYGGGGVSVIVRDSVRHFGDQDGLPAGTVFALAQDSAGAIWIGTWRGLAKLDGERWHGVGAEEGFVNSRVSGLAEVTSIIVDRRGQLWVAAGEGIFRRTRDAARFELIERKPRLKSGGWDQYLAEAPDGTIWASDRRGLRIVDPVSRKRDASQLVPEVPDAIRVAIDQTGAIWVALHDGVQRVVPGARPMFPERERLDRERGLSGGGEVNALLEDREGNLWIGTGGGIDRFRRSKLTRTELPPGAVGPFALAAGDSGSVWIGPSSLVPMRVGARIESFSAVQRRVDAAYADAAGTVWFGGDRGLWQSTRGDFARVQLPSVHFITVQAIAGDDSGSIWVSLVGQQSAAYRRVGSQWVARGGQAAMPSGMPLVMKTDESGRMWMGYSRNRVAVWSHGKLRVIGETEGLHVGDVFAIYGRGEHVWIGGEQGLAILAGDRVRPVTSKGDFAFRMITGIVELPNGDLWLHGAPGIARVSAAEARRAIADPTYQMTVEWFDYRDGLDGAPPLGPLPSMIESSDGRLWFSTNLDVASIDPNHISRNARAPNVVIEELTVGEQSFPIAKGPTLPVHTKALRIEFTALSLSIPERVRFRYRLEGMDDDWQDAGARREAFYTNLKPGSYRFRVIAANEDGVWNDSGAVLDFTIPPSFIQSKWFLAVWVLALSALAWVAYRIRMRQVAVGLRARYAAALTERTRIAQELHDTLLQGFTGITIQLRAIQRVLTRRPEEGVAALEAALTTADTTLRDARNTIWDMRAVELEGHELPEALEGAVRSVLTGAPTVLHFTVRGDRRPLTPHLETTALRIGREAVLNALKHADARKVEVSLDYDAQMLRLQIRDDGRGMASGVAEAAAADGHLGIAGMKARAHHAAGAIEIDSEPGRGTTVRVSLPITS